MKNTTKKNGRLFNWTSEFKLTDRQVFKLTIRNNPEIVQGLLAVTNKAAKLFGDDLNFKGQFNYENEKKEIHDNTWQGRHWRLGEIDIALEINEGTKKFNLVLVLPKSKHTG